MNSYSAGNYQRIEEESTGRMVIPPGITRVHRNNCYSTVITSSGTRNREMGFRWQ
jgi:hypothetical protein